MTDFQLTDIEGVADGSAKSLENAGFETVLDVAIADEEDVAEADGFGPSRALDVIEAAGELVDDVEDVDDEFTAGGDEAVEEDEDDAEVDLVDDDPEVEEDVYPVRIKTSRTVFRHIIHVVLEEATAKRQSGSTSMRDAAYRVADDLMAVHLEATSGVDVTLELDHDELNALYRALNQGALDYANRAGISGMYGSFETVKKGVNEVRKEAME